MEKTKKIMNQINRKNKPCIFSEKLKKNLTLYLFDFLHYSDLSKICSANNESPYETARNNDTNRVHSVRDFDLDNNIYSKTSLNFFSKYINTSFSSNEEYNNNNCETLTQTFTPSRQKDSSFNEDEKEQFTPY